MSEPLAQSGSSAGLARVGRGPAVAGGITYVSLLPGTEPDGRAALVRNVSTGELRRVPMVGGGFDPVELPASVGDELTIEIRGAAGVIALLHEKVPARRAPRVVRVDPPKGKTDVPLNAHPGIVFSEPMDAATLTTATVRLAHLRSGLPVEGTVQLDAASGLTAEFVPASPLEPRTEYLLVVERAVRDRTGDALEAVATSEFTTTAASTQPALDGAAISAVSAGSAHTCAITDTQVAYCWGSNGYGQLGTGTSCPNTSAPCPTVTPVPVAGGHAFKRISAGSWTSCAVTTDGTAYCWGANYWGQLGIGSACSNPNCLPVVTPTAVVGGRTFASIGAGAYHSCGLSEGVAYCWGDGGAGQLGSGPASGLAFAALSVSDFRSCALTEAGGGYCWGVSYDTPPDDRSGWMADTAPRAVFPGRALRSLATSDYHTCAIAAAGDAYCRGLNGSAQIGATTAEFCSVNDGTFPLHVEPCTRTPLRVGGGLTFASVTVGAVHSCALTTAGAAYCWGANQFGQIGDGTTTQRELPVAVLGGLTFATLSAGGLQTCGITTGAALYCWGDNSQGQLGDGTTLSRSTPVRVAGPR